MVTGQTYYKIIIKYLSGLIKDEQEAIDGYNKAIIFAGNHGFKDTFALLHKIRDQEIEHKRELEQWKARF